jgi:hypothetical protein
MAECFSLTYATTTGSDNYMPRRVRLERTYADAVPPRRTWYAARTDKRSWFDAAWRPAHRDSIDVASYHSPRIRLPSRGDYRVGQVIPTGALPLFIAMFERRETVIAHRVPCQEM